MHEEERRYRDYMKDIAGRNELHGNEAHDPIKKRVFLVNTNSPLVNTLFQLKDHNIDYKVYYFFQGLMMTQL